VGTVDGRQHSLVFLLTLFNFVAVINVGHVSARLTRSFNVVVVVKLVVVARSLLSLKLMSSLSSSAREVSTPPLRDALISSYK